MKKEFEVSKFGIFSSVVVSTIGIATFSYPNELSVQVGTDGWFIVLLGGVVSYIFILIIIKLLETNNWSNFAMILKNNYGKFIGSILSLFFVFYCIISMAIGIRTFIEVLKMYLLEKTPTEFLFIVTLLTGIYIIRGGLDTLIRFNEIAFWIMFVPIVFILLLLFSNADFTNIFPIMSNKPMEYIKSLPTSIYIFKGFEIMLLIIPYMKIKSKIRKVAFFSTAFISVFYIIIFIFTLAVFSKYQTATLLWPAITMIKSINIPGSFIERWDGIVMTMWILFYYTTFVNTFYFSSDVVKNVFNFKTIKSSYIFIVPLIYLTALYPENLIELNDIRGLFYQSYTMLMIAILPLATLIKSILSKAGGD